MPRWIAAPAAVTLIVMTGLVGHQLAWTWAQDGRAIGPIANQLLAADTLPSQFMVPPEASETAWWATTSGHLLLRALATSRSEPNTTRDGEVRDLLKLARGASPLDPAVRVAMLRVGDSAVPLGASRDVVALHAQGNRLRDAGKLDAAMASYRAALAIAVRSQPTPDDHATFFEDPRVRRFALPHEESIAELVGDMISSSRGNPDLWAAALPASSPMAALAAYRLLRERRDPAASRALDLILESPAPGAADASDLAARGEALALDGRLPEAAQHYRDAIELVPPGRIRRILAYNLSDIEGRLGNLDAMLAAWDDARSPDLHDEVNLRLVEARARRSREITTRLAYPSDAPRDDAVQQATYRAGTARRP